MREEHILITNFNGSPNVGLFGYCNEEYCLLGQDIPKKTCKEVEKILKVPVHKINMAGTSLLGVFCVGNKNALLLPSMVFEHELKKLDKLGIKYALIDTKLTALGNNILVNDKGAIVNPDFTDSDIKQIESALGVKAKRATIAELDNVGSLAAMNKKNCMITRNVKESEVKLVEKTLGVECATGTINFGLPYIKSGVLVNSKGFIVSDQSTGIELVDADSALGFI